MRALFALLFLYLLSPLSAQIKGCTDPMANNYNATAQKNDGSCTYTSTSIAPVQSQSLPIELNETSGLLIWNKRIWTHNDDTDTKLYACKPDTASVYNLYSIPRVFNKDWEEITQDSHYVYVGDFGNNTGNRTDLKILRISKISLNNNNPKADTISFYYENQTDFNPAGANQTDFDCEAFIARADSLYLFTKEWNSQHTTMYVLPNKPGNYAAKLRNKYNVGGLITGAAFYEPKNTIVLCGYSNLLQPFVVLLYDFEKMDVFAGNKRKININQAFHQIEGIATENGLTYYISNEKFVQSFITVDAKLQILDLNLYLFEHINSSQHFEQKHLQSIAIYPNPANQFISFLNNHFKSNQFYFVKNTQGKIVLTEKTCEGINTINTSMLPPGIYCLYMEEYKPTIFIKKN